MKCTLLTFLYIMQSMPSIINPERIHLKMMKQYLSLALHVLFCGFFFFGSSHQASLPPQNPRLLKAYEALQAWKHAITSDPKNITSNWYGPDVCNYNGVTCAQAPDDSHVKTVAGIDLNHAGISGSLPEALGLLRDLAFFHINSNRFFGTIPRSFRKLRLLYELDVSNNQFSGSFPLVVLDMPALIYVDIRYNGFQGEIPVKLWDLKLDGIFINNNKFSVKFPNNIGNSPCSVLVMANNNFRGCFPTTISKFGKNLEELILSNSGLTGCIPPEVGKLTSVTVFDVSSNKLIGSLPETIEDMRSLEQLNVANNKLSGDIPASTCSLPKLDNFTFSNNYFDSEAEICLKLSDKDDKKNCFPDRPSQRSDMECNAFLSHPVSCEATGCPAVRSPSPPPRVITSPPPPPPTAYPPT